MKRALVTFAGILFMFGSIWLSALGYNELPEGYQFASFVSGSVGGSIGFFIAMLGIIEEI